MRAETGHRPLMASEFLQMAGRAGRRGLDREGHVVTVQSRFEGVREAGRLATSPADPLVSQFTPGYSMVLNLLQRYSLSQARELVERSFGRYLASLGLVDEQQAIAQLAAQAATMGQQLADVPLKTSPYKAATCLLQQSFSKGRNWLGGDFQGCPGLPGVELMCYFWRNGK